MSAEVTSANVADQYLKRLRHALRHARGEDREDYLCQISEHLSESQGVESSLDELIRRVGAPEVLAQEFYMAERAKLSRAARFSRWLRHWWVAVIGLIVLLAVIPIYWWASSYQPLSTRMNGSYLDRVVSTGGAPPVKLVGGFSAPVTWKLTHGRYRLSILFDASNDNSLAVGIAPVEWLNGFPNPVAWHLENSDSDALTRFERAQVRGDRYQEILFTETYDCTPWPKGSQNANATQSTLISNLPIVESFWGFQHTVELAVQPFYLEFAGNCFGG
jgi:hypothetical protein